MGCQGMKEQHRTRWEEEEADCAPSSSRCPQPDDIPDHTDISDESEYESADEFDDYMDDSCWRIQSAEEDRAAHRLWARLSQKDCIQTADFDFWLGYRRNAGFLHSCLRASSMSLDKAYDIAKRFAQLRADANWPLRLSAHHVKNTLHTGMHWLLRGRDNVGRAVVVYNAAKLDLQHAPVGDYQQMGCVRPRWPLCSRWHLAHVALLLLCVHASLLFAADIVVSRSLSSIANHCAAAAHSACPIRLISNVSVPFGSFCVFYSVNFV